MELQGYVRAIRRRLWVVILIPTLAASAAGGYVLFQPSQYQGKATVIVSPQIIGTHVVPALTSVQNFIASAKSASVADYASRQTAVPAAAISEGLTAEQVEGSNVVDVTFIWSDRKKVSQVVREASGRALELLATAAVAPARSQLEIAENNLESIQAEADAFIQETHLADPSAQYERAAAELDSLRAEAERLRADGRDDEAAALDDRIAAREAALVEMGQQVIAWQRIENRRAVALSNLTFADGRYLAAEADIRTARDRATISAAPPREVPRLRAVVRAVIGAGVLGALLAVGLLALLELVRPKVRSTTPLVVPGIQHPVDASR